ncbi:hypothetical protein RFI_31710 [Reticulomyxa filosa]|uniref:Uncharacterized protein n=1 Tax=Reticulomyxa filosa TaxID=46433 RepID=X6LX11_RETFI|nr:hypothetical protein RFI_31710 [Reticulomyxa filosa]|eukprot:ETO05687.1 hypothetical protein RFI_31710 [Reticulomyxa filosa]
MLNDRWVQQLQLTHKLEFGSAKAKEHEDLLVSRKVDMITTGIGIESLSTPGVSGCKFHTRGPGNDNNNNDGGCMFVTLLDFDITLRAHASPVIVSDYRFMSELESRLQDKSLMVVKAISKQSQVSPLLIANGVEMAASSNGSWNNNDDSNLSENYYFLQQLPWVLYNIDGKGCSASHFQKLYYSFTKGMYVCIAKPMSRGEEIWI